MIRRFNSMTEGMSPQTKNAFRIHLIGLPATILTASIYLITAFQYGSWQLYAWSADIWVLALAALAGIFLIRQGRVANAVWLLLITLQITFLVAVALIDDTGLTIGISITILVAIIAGQTLSSRQAVWAIILGTISGIIAVLIELFSLFQRHPQPPLIRLYLPGILIAVTLLFGYVTIQQFRHYLLRTKLIIIFIAIALGSIGAVAFLSSATLQASLTDGIGAQLSTLANSKASEIGQALDRDVDILKTLSYNQLVQDLSAASNEQGPLAKLEIDQLDIKWQKASASNNTADPLVSAVIANRLGDEFRQFQEDFPQHIEIFLTNQQGINVAATNITSDYYQADEEWWQVAYQKGLYIGQPEYDESIASIAIIIAARVNVPETESPIGVLRTTITLAALTDSLASGLFGQTGHTDIYLPNGQEIQLEVGEDGTYKTELVDAELDIDKLTQSNQKYQEIAHNNIPTLASQALVTTVPGDVDEDATAISNLNWRVVVLQDQSEAFQAVELQTRNLILLAIAISIAVTFAAISMAQVISAPISRLNSVANKIASGELSVQAQIESGDEIGTLAASFNKMTAQINELIGTLEDRVAERTADLEKSRLLSEKRAQELQSISEISRTISTEQRMEILLPLVTRLVSERFDFYHVGIFFVDNSRQFAVLQAANSEGGKRMIERGHRLEMGVGIVGNVAAAGKPRIALDVGSDAVFFNNPDLPETRSEMALPLNVRGQTIGVLDVQSTRSGAFTESDASTLGILADQVAIALDNARLFGQAQESLNELQKLYRQYQSQEWSEFIRQATQIGYYQTMTGGTPLTVPVMTDEIKKALGRGEVVVLDGSNEKSQPVIAVPVKLRGQTLGVLNINAPKRDRKWSQDEINLVQAISDRLALALDNARLLQESQRRAAKEQKIGEVTAKIGASINMRNVLQTAVEELGRALPGSEVVIQFQASQEN